MDCPRCGSSLVAYALRDRRTLGCDACGYVGIEVDHHVEREAGETWAEALERFAANDDDETTELTPAIVEIEESS